MASTNIAGNAFGIAYDSGKSELFVSVQNSDYFNDINSILVISDTDNKVVGNISLSTDASPAGIAYDSARGEVFVANSTGDDVLIISDASDKIIKTVSVGNYPYSVAYDATKGEIFVGSGQSGPGVVSVISDTTDSVIATIPVGADPYSMAYDPSKGEMYVADETQNSVSVISDSNNSVVTTITVGDLPSGIVYDSGKGEMFVADEHQDAVSVINDATDSVVATITSSNLFGPIGMAYDPATGEIFVGNQGNASEETDDVSVISDATDSVTEVVNAGILSTVLAYDPARGEVFVGSNQDETLSVISVGASQVSTTASSSSSTQTTSLNSSNCFTYTLDSEASVECLTGTYVTTTGHGGPGEIGVGAYPIGLAYDSAKGETFVADLNGPTVSVVSDTTGSVIATINIPGVNSLNFTNSPSPQYVAYDPANGLLYVSNLYGNCVTVISDANNSIVTTVNLGNQSENGGQGLIPGDLVYDSGRGEVFVLDEGAERVVGSYPNNVLTTSGVVSVISTSTNAVVASIPVDDAPNAIAYDPARGEIFVGNIGKTANDSSASNTATGLVSVISDSSNSVVANIPVGPDPDGMTYDPSKGEIFVSNEGSASVSGSISVVSDSSNSVIATIPLADAGESVYDPTLGEVVVVTPDSDSAAVISDATDSVVGTESAGPHPFSIAYDSGKGEIFVSNPLNDTLTVISGASTTSSSASTKASSTSLTSSYLLIVAADVVVIGILGALSSKRTSGASVSEKPTSIVGFSSYLNLIVNGRHKSN